MVYVLELTKQGAAIAWSRPSVHAVLTEMLRLIDEKLSTTYSFNRPLDGASEEDSFNWCVAQASKNLACMLILDRGEALATIKGDVAQTANLGPRGRAALARCMASVERE